MDQTLLQRCREAIAKHMPVSPEYVPLLDAIDAAIAQQAVPMDAEAWAELHRLRDAVKGPDGFATWQEAATAERTRRVAAERAIAQQAEPICHVQPWELKQFREADSKGLYSLPVGSEGVPLYAAPQPPVAEPDRDSTVACFPPDFPVMPHGMYEQTEANKALWSHACLTGWRCAAPAEPLAWATEGGDRAITHRQRETALRDGGASASSVRSYCVPLYAAPQPPVAEPSGWVLVSERVPEKDQRVLYYFEHVGVHAGRFVDGTCVMDSLFGGPSGWLTGDVTHWQPLPEPPKEST